MYHIIQNKKIKLTRDIGIHAQTFCFWQTCPNNKKKTIRRRRSSNTESNSLNKYKEETSSVSFTVVDRFDGTNGSEGIQYFYVVYNFKQNVHAMIG